VQSIALQDGLKKEVVRGKEKITLREEKSNTINAYLTGLDP